MSTEDVLFDVQNGWGVMTLNRPKAFNAITREMCQLMFDQLTTWAGDEAIAGVILKSNHEKAFCAGGDIRWMHDTSLTDPAEAATMFRVEYRLNSLIHHYKKPYISFVSGICMGGGVGISISSDRTIVSEKTVWAMPETGIGMIPDVGGSYFLSRMKDGFGLYLGLTGDRLKSADVVSAGVATDFVAADQHEALMQALVALGSGATMEQISAVIDDAAEPVVDTLEDKKEFAKAHFAKAGNVEAVFALLENAGENDLVAKMRGMSPTSMKLTKTLIDHGEKAGFDDCLRMEFRVVRRLMDGPDFQEGVRAVIIDKDHAPKWQPGSIEETDDEAIAGYLAPLKEKELQLP
jgi:enoyl-CoA hydratase/carnithine racemase